MRRADVDHQALVCGAGAAGLSSAAMLQRRGVQTVILERSQHVAASWRGRYDGLRLNTLGVMSRQPGYLVRFGPRRFPSRDEWVRYLERFAEHHRLEIRCGTEARRVDRDGGCWRIETSDGTARSRFVVVATGYDREPVVPDWPGRATFRGELLHSAQFRNAGHYSGRDVLVVGPNVTGSELAFFLAESGAARVRVAVRTPPNILRRCRFGVPLNPAGIALEHLPAAVGDRAAALSQRLTFGDLSRYGLPRPPMGLVSTNRKRRQGPAIDDGFVDAVKQGRIEIVAAVEGFEGADVLLADRSRVQPDVVVAATGYRRGLEPLVGHLDVLDDDGRPRSAGGRPDPQNPDLFFVGYRTPLYGQLRSIRLEAKRVARAVTKA
jgi:putative flavoprotein involved in K+ transport